LKLSTEKNVIGSALESCGIAPVTGFERDGTCRTPARDFGIHGVCGVVTDDFLKYTKSKGNDLSTPNPLHGFPGLKPGDRWCLCASRWKKALANGTAPPVILAATSEAVLNHISLEDLLEHAADNEQRQ